MGEGSKRQRRVVHCGAMFYLLHGLLPARADAWEDLSGGRIAAVVGPRAVLNFFLRVCVEWV